jgi:glycosyltransferase involved in cell wall biosynthesis
MPTPVANQVADASPAGALGPGDRCAYLVSRYPAVTHAFIAEEVRAFREAGVRVETVSIRRAPPEEIVSEKHRREFESTRALVPAQPLAMLGDHLRAFARAPVAFVRTLLDALRMSGGGLRAVFWQLFYFGEAMMLWNHLRRRDVRHVHVHFPTGASDAALLATTYGNRSARAGDERWTWSLSCHGPTEFTDITRGRLATKLDAADAVICASHWVYSQILAWTPPTRPDRVHVVRCGIDLEAFTPVRAAASDASSPVRVLNVAGMSPRKGQLVLVQALARLRSRGRDVTLALIGDGSERVKLEAEVARLGLHDHVTFLGALGHDAVRTSFEQADIFCLPSLAEGAPFVLMEAMASGVPVVATTVAGIPELIEHRVSGLLVTPARDDELADALDALVTDSELRRRLAVAGRRRVETERDLHSLTAELRQVIGAALRTRGPRERR